MYPPTDEPDSARVARNQAQSRWLVPALYLASGLLALVIAGAPKGGPTLGVSWLAIGIVGMTRAYLEHRPLESDVKRRQIHRGSATRHPTVEIRGRGLK